RGEPATRGTHRRCLGALRPTSRRDDAAACARPHRHHAGNRNAAEPRRRQSVLGGALRRARRGDAAELRALVNRAGDSDEAAATVVESICSLLGAWDAVPTDLPNIKPVLAASATLQRRDLSGALPDLVGAAQSAASVIRDRFSPDAWLALTDVHELIN